MMRMMLKTMVMTMIIMIDDDCDSVVDSIIYHSVLNALFLLNATYQYFLYIHIDHPPL